MFGLHSRFSKSCITRGVQLDNLPLLGISSGCLERKLAVVGAGTFAWVPCPTLQAAIAKLEKEKDKEIEAQADIITEFNKKAKIMQ
eukprot:scaffold301880_cov17-Tisochrysis_lutea.AAC.1